jgi:hypothetical protein
MKKSVISTLMLLGALTVHAQMPAGNEFKNYQSRTIDLFLQSRFYKATGNFTKSGNSYDSLPSGYDYENYLFDFGARSTIFSKWAIFASATVGAAQSQDPTTTRTNSAFSEGTLGADFLLSEGSIAIVPELSVTFPFTKNDVNTDTVAVGEGVMSTTARLIAAMRTGSLRLGAFAGFTYRDDGLSSLLPYGALAEYQWASTAFGADIRGYSTLGYDKDSDNETPRNNYICRANGCAKRYAAVNPSLIESNLWLRLNLSRSWDLYGGAGFALTGQNTSTGYSANAGVIYRWDLGPARSSGPASRQRVVEPGFHEEVDDGVDQDLFTPPPSPPPPRPAPTPRADPDAQRNRIRKKMQEDLDKTEMQIELKSTKKKSP